MRDCYINYVLTTYSNETGGQDTYARNSEESF
jgi:hypothetical protein